MTPMHKSEMNIDENLRRSRRYDLMIAAQEKLKTFLLHQVFTGEF